MVNFHTNAWFGPLTQQHHYDGFLYQHSTWPTHQATPLWWILVPTLDLAHSPGNIVMMDFHTNVWLGPLTQQHCYDGFLCQHSTWPTHPATSLWWIFVPTLNLAHSPSNIILADYCTNTQLGPLTQQHHHGKFLYQCSTWSTHPATLFQWILVPTLNLAHSPSNIDPADSCTNAQLGSLTQQHHYGKFSYQHLTWPPNPTTSFQQILVPMLNLAHSPSNIFMTDLANSSQSSSLVDFTKSHQWLSSMVHQYQPCTHCRTHQGNLHRYCYLLMVVNHHIHFVMSTVDKVVSNGVSCIILGYIVTVVHPTYLELALAIHISERYILYLLFQI